MTELLQDQLSSGESNKDSTILTPCTCLSDSVCLCLCVCLDQIWHEAQHPLSLILQQDCLHV